MTELEFGPEAIDPEIAAAQAAQAALHPTTDATTLPVAEARALAERRNAFWNTERPPLAAVEELSLPGPAGPLRARLYRPHGAAADWATLYLHGGGWVICSIDTHDRIAAQLAHDSGAAVLAVDYRLAPEHPFPAGLEDCLAAAAWLRGRFPRIAVAGDSAGANLALAAGLALRDRGEGAAALGLFYGCYAPDFSTESYRRYGDGRVGLSRAGMEWFWRHYLGGTLAAPPALAAPLTADLAGLPPCYLNLAALDVLRDDTVRLAGRLAAAGVPHRLDVWPGAPHGFLHMVRMAGPAARAVAAAGAALRDLAGRAAP
ncbi:MAG TPA: alpha/beta hydrolase [Alphaproteobacteria bacterium]|nr:alpha/beta hydrolase [Alphaproteobacteria bacterium]